MNDYAKIKELLHVLRNVTFPETTNESEAQGELSKLETRLLNSAGASLSSELN